MSTPATLHPLPEFTGMSWMLKKVKIPSRNTLIFLSISSSVLGLYIYDRQQCNKIRQEYIDKVKHLSEETSDHLGWPRKVTVYGCKWPGDEDYEQCMKYFRKYVKPVFVAAAVDYEMVTGKKHGDLANRIAEEIKKRRRLELGWETERPSAAMPPAYEFRSTEVLRQQELDGGIVIVGRPTWKEFMYGLKRGWTESPEKVDMDEALAQELENDPHFDDVDPSEVAELAAKTFNSQFYNSLQHQAPPKAVHETPFVPGVVPALPPILFVSFTDYIGLKLVPQMLYDFFNRRHLVRSGAHEAYQLIMKETRPFRPPPNPTTDLDFGKHSESYYKGSLDATQSEIDRQRKKYYEELPSKLATARELARNIREPTKDEIRYPPLSEVELRAERMEKEKKWRHAVSGWEIVKPSTPIAWDPRFEGIFTVFTDPIEVDLATTSTHN